LTHLDPKTWAFSEKKPVLPKKTCEKPAFKLPAGFSHKTWVLQALRNTHLYLFAFFNV
jgi:hypothetical protein